MSGKCDELKPIRQGSVELGDYYVYDAEDVDAAIDELKTEHHKERHEYIEMVALLRRENAELKQKLENVQASMYADVVDANMENRRLRRTLWLTRGAVHKAKRLAMYGLLQAYPLWEGRPAGLEVHKNIHRYDGYERKCRKKAEEYK